jgi:hypothetical protein
MPRLPREAFKLVTTRHEDKYEIGEVLLNPRQRGAYVQVVAIVQRNEYGDIVYDIYVIPYNG